MITFTPRRLAAVLAASALSAASAASAEDVLADLSLLTPVEEVYQIDHFETAPFTDTLFFFLDGAGGALNVRFDALGVAGLTFTGGSLFDSDSNKLADLLVSPGGSVVSLDNFAITPSGGITQYSFQLDGFASAGDFYLIGASAQPVPEPETYALYLAGLGLVGAALRRRHAAH